jgi:hypothetical protein
MIIKVERTGGFAGISECTEMNSNDLPGQLRTTVMELANGKIGPTTSMKSVPTGAADHYSYRIIIDDGHSPRVIECNEHDINDRLMSLITYVHKNARKRK